MNSLITYFNCGYTYKKTGCISFNVEKFSDISEKIIPFFNKYHILGIKNKDFLD